MFLNIECEKAAHREPVESGKSLAVRRIRRLDEEEGGRPQTPEPRLYDSSRKRIYLRDVLYSLLQPTTLAQMSAYGTLLNTIAWIQVFNGLTCQDSSDSFLFCR